MIRLSAKQVDGQEIGVGKNFGAIGPLELKGAGDSGLASGMANVSLIVELRDRVGTEHSKKPTK